MLVEKNIKLCLSLSSGDLGLSPCSTTSLVLQSCIASFLFNRLVSYITELWELNR